MPGKLMLYPGMAKSLSTTVFQDGCMVMDLGCWNLADGGEMAHSAGKKDEEANDWIEAAPLLLMLKKMMMNRASTSDSGCSRTPKGRDGSFNF